VFERDGDRTTHGSSVADVLPEILFVCAPDEKVVKNRLDLGVGEGLSGR
jgi:hypothetical protein